MQSTASKRKSDNDKVSACLSEQIKRCRISVTPGELRLRKDISAITNLRGVEFDYPNSPSSLIIRFTSTDLSSLCPKSFHVTVPRFYPHDLPIVKCLDSGFHNEFLDADGIVRHINLAERWTALNNLADILNTLESVRQSFTSADNMAIDDAS